MSVLSTTGLGVAVSILGLCCTTQQLLGQNPTAEDGPTSAVVDYLHGADEQNASRVSGSLHEDVFHATVLPGNQISVVDKTTYVGAIRDKQIGGVERSYELGEAMIVGGNLATVAVGAENPTLRFDYLFTLIQQDGAWTIISSVAVVNRL